MYGAGYDRRRHEKQSYYPTAWGAESDMPQMNMFKFMHICLQSASVIGSQILALQDVRLRLAVTFSPTTEKELYESDFRSLCYVLLDVP
jgi:hypothetical protein